MCIFSMILLTEFTFQISLHIGKRLGGANTMMDIRIESGNFSHKNTMEAIEMLKERGFKFVEQAETGPYDLHFTAEGFCELTAVGTVVAIFSYFYKDMTGGRYTYFCIDGKEYEHHIGMTALECIEEAA